MKPTKRRPGRPKTGAEPVTTTATPETRRRLELIHPVMATAIEIAAQHYEDTNVNELYKKAKRAGVEIEFGTRSVPTAEETGSSSETKKIRGWFGQYQNGKTWYYLGANSQEAAGALPEEYRGPFLCQPFLRSK